MIIPDEEVEAWFQLRLEAASKANTPARPWEFHYLALAGTYYPKPVAKHGFWFRPYTMNAERFKNACR